MKELYATGEWVKIYKKSTSSNEWLIPRTNIEKWISEYEYKLIHKKHADVLEHVLNGGETTVEDPEWDKSFRELEADFIGNYDDELNYYIIKDKPPERDLNQESANRLHRRNRATARVTCHEDYEISEEDMQRQERGYEPKQVERITREGLIHEALYDLKIDGHTKRGLYNAISCLEKYLEANQKDNQ